MGYYCSVCKTDISRRVYRYSMEHFGKALCMAHQGSERIQRSEFKFCKANEMRENMTPAESRMWKILYYTVHPMFPRHKFYPQSNQYGYILDFYCPTLQMGLEVDGEVHAHRQELDRQKDDILAGRGIQVFRISNDEVLNTPDEVTNELCQIIRDKTTPWYKKIFR